MVMEMENPHKPVNKGKCKMKMKMYVTRYSDRLYSVRKCTVYPYVKVKKKLAAYVKLLSKHVGLSGRFITPNVQQACQMHACFLSGNSDIKFRLDQFRHETFWEFFGRLEEGDVKTQTGSYTTPFWNWRIAYYGGAYWFKICLKLNHIHLVHPKQ